MMQRYIKFAVVALVVLFIVMTALSLLFPSHLRVLRAVNIAAPREKIFESVSDLRTWDQWNQFVQTTSLTHKTWSDPSAGKGAWMRSDQLTLRETAVDSDGIALEWDFKGGKTYPGGISLLQALPDSITVQWWFDLSFRWYPWEKLGIFVYDRKLGPAMEESFTTLKRNLENSR